MEEGGSIVHVLPRRRVVMIMTLFLLNTMEPYPAQELWGDPPSFPIEFGDSIRQHFCDGCPSVTETPRCWTVMQTTTLCRRACQKEDCPNERCLDNDDGSEESYPTCEDSQETQCSFEDAVICRYKDGRGFCVFEEKSDERVSLCICKNQPGEEDDYKLWEVSCNEEDREPYEGKSRPVGPTTKVPPTSRTPSKGGQINIAVPLLSSVLAVVLVVLVVMAVVLYSRRRGNSPALLNNKTPIGTKDSTSVELESNVSKQLPLVPDENPQADYHTYYSLDFNDKGEGSTRYVVHGQNSAPSEADKVPSTEDANHEYSVLEKTHSAENIPLSDPDCTIATTESLPEAPVETESVRSPVLKTAENETPLDGSGYEIAVVAPPKENICSPVLKTVESQTAYDQSGYEVAVVATPPADANDSSLYDHFDRSTSRLSKVEDQENSDYQHLEKV